MGGIAAVIATGMGFQKGDDILETLKDGSIFTEILQEHWRHQLENYNIVSFWGSLDNVSVLVHDLPCDWVYLSHHLSVHLWKGFDFGPDLGRV